MEIVEDNMQTNPFFRYQHDVWYFGILLTSGKTLLIECIEDVFPDFIRVTMHKREDKRSICNTWGLDGNNCIASTCSRTTALVRKDQIVMIYELADT